MENVSVATALKLPIGIENFEEIRTEGFYYIDKTGLIKELLENWGKVNLFTRPRRFGKTLNMSMLKYFFEIGQKPSLFAGLEIEKEDSLFGEYQGRFPVISISLKGVSGRKYETARSMMCSVIGREAMRFQFLLESEKISEKDKGLYEQLTSLGDETFRMTDTVLVNSLLTLSNLLHKFYDRKVIILIDEYDVPLDKACQFGYYDEMVTLVRNIFNQGLKSNDSLYFSVLTGCLRVSKESIFTGLNNPKVLSITDVRFDEYFGFTNEEVRKLLEDYGLSDRFDLVKEWYDGYKFGEVDVYCPWDVINYCDLARVNANAEPDIYWSHTSDNSIVKRFIQKATRKTRDEIESLIAGESIVKQIRQELTYSELDQSIDNLWSVLFTTGYLTQCESASGNKYRLIIPNKEIHRIFETQIQEWFQEEAMRDSTGLDAFCNAFAEEKPEEIEERFNRYLMKTISLRDTGAAKTKKENFYHGILLGLLGHKEEWSVFSNAESGEGYSDILIEIPEKRIGVVIEVKYAEGDELKKGCSDALKQIEEKYYTKKLTEDGMKKIVKYGIACYRKHCKVVQG